MKKLLVLLISVLMIVSSMSVSAFAETTKPSDDVTTISVDDLTAYPGGTVSVPVKISNNKGLWGMMFNVCFDTSVFEVVEVRNNGDVFAAGDITIGPADFSVGYVRVVVVSSDISKNNIKNGSICIIKLKVAKDAELANYPFTLDFGETDFCDVKGNVVAATYDNGSVTLKNKKELQQVETTNKNDVEGELLAKAENNKYIEIETTAPLKTEIKTVDVTDENGKNVTNSNGEKQTRTEIVEVTEPTTVENNEAEAYGDKSVDIKLAIFIICGALVIAGCIVVAAVLIKKKKSK